MLGATVEIDEDFIGVVRDFIGEDSVSVSLYLRYCVDGEIAVFPSFDDKNKLCTTSISIANLKFLKKPRFQGWATVIERSPNDSIVLCHFIFAVHSEECAIEQAQKLTNEMQVDGLDYVCAIACALPY